MKLSEFVENNLKKKEDMYLEELEWVSRFASVEYHIIMNFISANHEHGVSCGHCMAHEFCDVLRNTGNFSEPTGAQDMMQVCLNRVLNAGVMSYIMNPETKEEIERLFLRINKFKSAYNRYKEELQKVGEQDEQSD